MLNRSVLMAVSVLAAATVVSPALAQERVYKDAKGRIRVTPVAIPEKDKNLWPAALEEQLIERSNHAIKFHTGKGYGNTYFENEKNAYPVAMLDFLGGNRDKALGMLQADDSEGYNKYTNMVDFYPCFTLKGQMRKYYFFGDFLTPEYKKKFFEGAKVWTATDPAKRPIAALPKDPKKQPGAGGWMPDATGASVDTRATDNLRAMREVSVYLMAEETGNKEVAAEYKNKIKFWVTNLWTKGMGEWDSNNYLSHTFTGYINLYDFAKDPEVRGYAKAALDMITTSAAVKYYRGDFGGPSKRDYGGKLAFGTNAANEFWFYFGDAPIESPSPDRDDIHLITSWYRPPLAVLNLAQKKVDKPVEIWASKPVYEVWKMSDTDGPAYFETTTIGNTWQLGSLSEGSSGDMNGFKLMTYSSKRGTDNLYCSTAASLDSKAISTGSAGGDEIAQMRNLCIFLNGRGEVPFNFFVPKTLQTEDEGGVKFFKFEQTWVALWPINMTFTGKADLPVKKGEAAANDEVLQAKGNKAFAGFAMEIGEQQTHGDYAAFKQKILKNAKLAANEGTVTLTGSDGSTLKMEYSAANGQPRVTRNGKVHDWSKHWPLYQGAEGGASPVTLGWKEGTLKVNAGGASFEATLSKENGYVFKHSPVK